MISIWQSAETCKTEECRFLGTNGNPIFLTITDNKGTTDTDSARSRATAIPSIRVLDWDKIHLDIVN